MKKHDFFLILRLFIYVFEFFLLYSLELIPGLLPEIYSGRPLVLVLFFVSSVIFEKEIPALFLGFVCGILLDISFGTSPGVFALIMCLIGYFISILFKYFVKINLFFAMILNLFILVSICFLKIYFTSLKFGIQNSFYIWNNIFFPVICYSEILFPVAYFFNKYIYYKFVEEYG